MDWILFNSNHMRSHWNRFIEHKLGFPKEICTHSWQIKLTTPENIITYHNALCLSPQILHKHCLQFLLGVKMTLRETENNAYSNFWGDKQRALWYVMVFSGVVNYFFFPWVSFWMPCDFTVRAPSWTGWLAHFASISCSYAHQDLVFIMWHSFTTMKHWRVCVCSWFVYSFFSQFSIDLQFILYGKLHSQIIRYV